MTTNRAEAIDRAFQSRIHLTLRYPGLTAEAKTTIWRQFVQGTRWAAGNTLVDEQYQKLAALPINGREIKNIVKTEGLRGLYKGIVPNLLKVAPSMASSWLSFEMTRDFVMGKQRSNFL